MLAKDQIHESTQACLKAEGQKSKHISSILLLISYHSPHHGKTQSFYCAQKHGQPYQGIFEMFMGLAEGGVLQNSSENII